MRTLICTFLVCSATLSAANSAPVAPPIQNVPAPQATKADHPIQIDGRKWKVGLETKEEGRLIREYVLENEDVNGWNELFSIQQFSDVPVSPQEFFTLFTDGLKQAVPQSKLQSRIISDTKDSLLGEWWINDKSQNDQHEWIKIVKEGDEILIARYTTKKINDVEAVRKQWEDILRNYKMNKEI